MIDPQSTILVTGGCGFIGGHLVRSLLTQTSHRVCNIDALTYAGNRESLCDVHDHPHYQFHKIDIADATAVDGIFEQIRPSQVIHLAAESHVDRSIDGPSPFIRTNVNGTLNLLQAARRLLDRCSASGRDQFRFLHVSTDEVFGSLGHTGTFNESSRYDPRSPYSASKAAADHLVRAWHHTYGLPTLLTNGSNNYGPYQFPEKLIPVVILNAIAGRPIPVYGRGENVRDWLHVQDHVKALVRVLEHGRIGETYAIGGGNELRNIDLVHRLCDHLDELQPRSAGSYRQQIQHVTDRSGHDFRYAIDASRIQTELGWHPEHVGKDVFKSTVRWYLDNRWWWSAIMDRSSMSHAKGRAK